VEQAGPCHLVQSHLDVPSWKLLLASLSCDLDIRQALLIGFTARGTSENGPIGQIVGDPLVARVIRNMKDDSAQGYPVQVG
jgi:hypothetical protein